MTLNPSLKILILKHNNFHTVDASLSFYSDLEYLDITSNNLLTVPDRVFSTQRLLIKLIMNRNKISQLSKRTFSGLVKLQVLHLEENLLTRLPCKGFKHLESLRELNIMVFTAIKLSEDVILGRLIIIFADVIQTMLKSVRKQSKIY